MKTCTIDVYLPWGTRGAYHYLIMYRGRGESWGDAVDFAAAKAEALRRAGLRGFTHWRLMQRVDNITNVGWSISKAEAVPA